MSTGTTDMWVAQLVYLQKLILGNTILIVVSKVIGNSSFRFLGHVVQYICFFFFSSFAKLQFGCPTFT